MTYFRHLVLSVVCSALLELFAAVGLISQVTLPIAPIDKHAANLWLAARTLDKIPLPDDNPFQQYAAAPPVPSDEERNTADALTFHFDRGSTTLWAVETYSAPNPVLMAPQNLVLERSDWANGNAAGITLYLTKTNDTALQFMSDLESTGVGSNRTELYQSGAEDFTMRWGVSHLYEVGKRGAGFLQFDVAAFQEWLVSPALLIGGPFADHLPSYTISSSGVESTFSLPAKDLAFSVQYGSEHLGNETHHHRLLMFDLSWTW